jgi:hypothetical protein
MRCSFRRRVLRAVVVAGLFALVSLASVAASAGATSAGDFSGPNAYALLRTLVHDIGPRPMGSPAEQRALAFAASKFKEYGCDTSYVLPMTVAGGVNTKSGVAVGIARGRTGRIIVIGGHIDSSGPDIPGANDDGSGAACVMELARVLVPRERQSTIVFCCFGGEEEGLRGSTHFVKEFPLIDSVALMLQVDMADGAGFLEMDPDAAFQVSAPRWLPAAAFEVYYGELGLKNLRYLTHTSTLNASTPGGTGSDHMPFLEKGIPAIDFTSDVSYPIHTQLDNLTTFDSSGLARSGMLVQRLAGRFDQGTPSRTTESYYLLQIGNRLWFLDHWILWSILVITLVVAVVALLRLRGNRVRDKSRQPRWSALKLILAALILQMFIWFPETLLGALRGYRYPWVNSFGGYVALALLCGGVGLWLALNLMHRLRLSADPYVYFLRMFVFLVVSTVALAVANPEIALYSGLALLFFSLAVLVRHSVVKGALTLAAFYLPLHLVFLEILGLFQRALTGSVITSWWKVGLIDGVYVLAFVVFSFPFVFGVTAVYRSSHRDLFLLRGFRRTWSLYVLVPAIVVVAVVLLNRPVYDARWQRSVRAEQRYEIGGDSSSLQIRGGEFLDGLVVNIAGRDTVLGGETNTFVPQLGKGSGVGWVTVSARQETRVDSSAKDTSRVVQRTVELLGTRRPLLMEIRYRSDQPFELESRWSQGARKSGTLKSVTGKTLSWYAFPDSILDVPVTLTMKPGQKVIENIELTYPDLAAPVTLRRELTTVTTRTIVTAADTIEVN